MNASRFVKGLMQEAGMSIREDAMGNIWSRWTGSDVDAGESSATLALRAAGLPGSCYYSSAVMVAVPSLQARFADTNS